MNESTLTVALRALSGLITTAWLGCASLAVMVFGAGGWLDTLTYPQTPLPPTPPAHGLPRGLALAIGIGGAVLVWLAWRALRRRGR